MASWPAMKKLYTKYCKKVNPKKASSFCLIALITILLFTVLTFGSGAALKSLTKRDFSFLTTANSSSLLAEEGAFLEPVKNILKDSPEMAFVQSNSLLGITPPSTINSKTLGTVLGTQESNYGRRAVVEYTVQQGDSLSSIASKFDISLNTLLWANDLTSRSVIKPGQKLIILPVSGVFYIVQKGDTLSEIAEIYEANVDEIVSFNELASEGDIYIGDALIVPGGEKPATIQHIALTPVAESYFIYPAEGKITQGAHGISGTAVDIANQCGKPVVAAASGTIQRAGNIWIGGNRVTILHPNGVVSYYGHLSTIMVSPGQTVSAGDIIGYIGNTGYTLGATGCHVHFEIRGASNFLTSYSVGSYLSWKK